MALDSEALKIIADLWVYKLFTTSYPHAMSLLGPYQEPVDDGGTKHHVHKSFFFWTAWIQK